MSGNLTQSRKYFHLRITVASHTRACILAFYLPNFKLFQPVLTCLSTITLSLTTLYHLS